MTDNDITTICSKIESLHTKILKSNFSEMVTESEILCLILAVQELNRQQARIEALQMDNTQLHSDIVNANMNLEHMTAEIERLQANNSSMQSTLAKMSMGVEQTKAEAIKECLDKVAVFCAESGLFQCEADEMLLFNYLDSLKMKVMLKANGMVGDTE